jgi:hypothetical protein
VKASVSVGAEGPDLEAATGQRLSRGEKVQVRGVRAGRARVSPTGAKRRSMLRAAVKGALEAEITVRTISGKAPVTTKVEVKR